MAKDTKEIYPDNVSQECRVILKVLDDDFGLHLTSADTGLLSKTCLNSQVLALFLDMIRYLRNRDSKLCSYVCGRLNKHWSMFLMCPAASSHHHNYASGLIEHTTQVADIVRDTCKTMDYPLNHSGRIVAAAILHDLGKVFEYSLDAQGKAIHTGTFDRHIEYGYYTAMEDGYRDIANMIATHHGKVEWGCLREPQDQYEWALHFADMISSQCYNRYEQVGE